MPTTKNKKVRPSAARNKKTSNSVRLVQLQTAGLRQRILLFGLAFALIGGAVMLYQSFANPERVTRLDEILIEYRIERPLVASRTGDEAVIEYNYQPVRFRVLGDGTVYCSDGSTTNVNRGKLAAGNVDKIFLQARATGLEKLADDIGATGQDSVSGFEVITLGVPANPKQVRVHADSARPEAFSRIAELMDTICLNATEKMPASQLPGATDPYSTVESAGIKLKDPFVAKAYAARKNTNTVKSGSISNSYEAETKQYDLINQDRARVGQNGLFRSDCVTKAAQQWAREMASRKQIAHSNSVYGDMNLVQSYCGTSGWLRLGENVGVRSAINGDVVGASAAMFGTVQSIYNNDWGTFLGSCTHRGQIESFTYTSSSNGHDCATQQSPGSAPYDKVGIGAYVTNDGVLYVAQMFAYCPGCGGGWSTPAAGSTVPVDPKLAISNVGAPGYPTAGSTVNRGQELAVRINVANSGGTANNAIIENAIPTYTTGTYRSGFAISGITSPTSGGSNTTYYWWKMATLSGGGNGYVDMKFRVNSDAPSGASICSTATIRADNSAKISASPICFKVATTTTTSPPPPPTTTTPPPTTTTSDRLGPEQIMYRNSPIYSANRYYYLVVQTDGNLVLYRNGGGAVWWTGTSTGYFLKMGGDCNLALYNSSSSAVWSSGTSGRGSNCFLKVQDDGRIAIYSGGGTYIWGRP